MQRLCARYWRRDARVRLPGRVGAALQQAGRPVRARPGRAAVGAHTRRSFSQLSPTNVPLSHCNPAISRVTLAHSPTFIL